MRETVLHRIGYTLADVAQLATMLCVLAVVFAAAGLIELAALGARAVKGNEQ